MTPANNSRLTHWLMGALLTVLLLVAGYLINVNEQRLSRLESLVTDLSDRVSRNEERGANAAGELRTIRQKVDRIYELLLEGERRSR